MRGTAKERIPYGAHVLCRGYDVSLAPIEIANGIARADRFWESRGKTAHNPGDHVEVDPIDGLGQRDLHAMANGPIMDPTRLYLPAGKISEAEWQQRTFEQFSQAGISDDFAKTK